MDSFFSETWRGLAEASLLDRANLVLGIVGVWLMIRRNLWAFPVGLVAVTVQGVLFWQAKFYADALLQVFFFVLLAYGWWHWSRHPGRPELPVTTLASRWRLLALAGAVLAWIGWGRLSEAITDSPMPYRDSFIAAFSVTGQWLQAQKKLENWAVWVATNIVAVWSYWTAGISYTAFLYLVYLVLALVGWRAWARVRQAA